MQKVNFLLSIFSARNHFYEEVQVAVFLYVIVLFSVTIYFYTVTFNVKYRQFGIGYIHTVQAFDYILEKMHEEVSFGAGDEEYKYRFTDKTTKLISLNIFNNKFKYISFKTRAMFHGLIKKVRAFFK